MSLFSKIVPKSDTTSQPLAVPSWKHKLQVAAGAPSAPEPPRRTLYLLLDCSTSMDDYGKLESAKGGAIGFCKEASQKGYAIGVIGFSHEPVCLREAELGWEGARQAMFGICASGSTDMTGALLMAHRKLKSRAGQKAVCLVTDGMPDDKDSALKAALALQTSGIEIMTLGTDDADKAFLDKIATSKDLSVKVPRQQLQQGVSDMARLLPG